MKDSVLHFLLLLFVVALLSLIAIRKEGFNSSPSSAEVMADAAAADGLAAVPEGQGSSSSSMVAAAVPEGQGSSSSSMAIREVVVPPVGSSSSSVASILNGIHSVTPPAAAPPGQRHASNQFTGFPQIVVVGDGSARQMPPAPEEEEDATGTVADAAAPIVATVKEVVAEATTPKSNTSKYVAAAAFTAAGAGVVYILFIK